MRYSWTHAQKASIQWFEASPFARGLQVAGSMYFSHGKEALQQVKSEMQNMMCLESVFSLPESLLDPSALPRRPGVARPSGRVTAAAAGRPHDAHHPSA